MSRGRTLGSLARIGGHLYLMGRGSLKGALAHGDTFPGMGLDLDLDLACGELIGAISATKCF